jgi:hypothetical protein
MYLRDSETESKEDVIPELLSILSHFIGNVNARNFFHIRESLFFRSLIGFAAILVITVKVASPFFHTHSVDEFSHSVVITSAHCDACDYEATQGIESGVSIILPVNEYTHEKKFFEFQSSFACESYLSCESRGPPQVS